MTDTADMRVNAGCVYPVGRLEIRLCKPDFSLHFLRPFHEGLLILQRCPQSPHPTPESYVHPMGSSTPRRISRQINSDRPRDFFCSTRMSAARQDAYRASWEGLKCANRGTNRERAE